MTEATVWIFLVGIYLAGVATIPMLTLAAGFFGWLTDRGTVTTCGCGKVFGSYAWPADHEEAKATGNPLPRNTLNRVSDAQFWWHKVSGEHKCMRAAGHVRR